MSARFFSYVYAIAEQCEDSTICHQLVFLTRHLTLLDELLDHQSSPGPLESPQSAPINPPKGVGAIDSKQRVTDAYTAWMSQFPSGHQPCASKVWFAAVTWTNSNPHP
jgi:hypothetical protein